MINYNYKIKILCNIECIEKKPNNIEKLPYHPKHPVIGCYLELNNKYIKHNKRRPRNKNPSNIIIEDIRRRYNYIHKIIIVYQETIIKDNQFNYKYKFTYLEFLCKNDNELSCDDIKEFIDYLKELGFSYKNYTKIKYIKLEKNRTPNINIYTYIIRDITEPTISFPLNKNIDIYNNFISSIKDCLITLPIQSENIDYINNSSYSTRVLYENATSRT